MNQDVRIFIDRGSIYGEFCRAHPELKVTDCWHNNSNSGPFAWVSVNDGCTDGHEVTIKSDDERWSYHGLSVGIVRWVDKPGGYVRSPSTTSKGE